MRIEARSDSLNTVGEFALDGGSLARWPFPRACNAPTAGGGIGGAKYRLLGHLQYPSVCAPTAGFKLDEPAVKSRRRATFLRSPRQRAVAGEDPRVSTLARSSERLPPVSRMCGAAFHWVWSGSMIRSRSALAAGNRFEASRDRSAPVHPPSRSPRASRRRISARTMSILAWVLVRSRRVIMNFSVFREAARVNWHIVGCWRFVHNA